MRLTIPKGTPANWVAAARHGTSPKVALGSRSVPELEAEVTKLRKELAETRMERDSVKKAAASLPCRAQDDTRLKVAIKAVHEQSRQTYGPLRMQAELAARGLAAGRDRIIRLRHELALRCKQNVAVNTALTTIKNW